MDSSKINQSALSYSCGTGSAAVNLYTGRLLFEHPDVSIGINTYEIDISHVYNSQTDLPDNISTYMGKGWNLNIQHYLFSENNKYYYVNGAGYKYEFALLNGNKYYDIEGCGLTLIISENGEVIEDDQGNKMFFSANKLIKTISSHNISKNYNYKNGKISLIYDSRLHSNNLEFEYESSSGLLKKIICKKDYAIKQEIEYFYTNNGYLERISKTVDGVCKNISFFKYLYDKLIYAVSMEDNTSLNFSYTDNKVSKVNTGVTTITSQVPTSKNTVQCTSNVSVGDNLYCGEIEKEIQYNIVDNCNQLGTDLISENTIIYNLTHSIVINEKSVTMLYYFNEKGFTTSILEAHNGNVNDLRTLEIVQGKSMLTEGTDYESINCSKAHVWSTDKVISTNNILSTKFSNLQDYRKLQCTNYISYTCSFWLKLNHMMNNSSIKIIVNSGSDEEDEAVTTFDKSSVGSWQYISMCISITNTDLNSIKLKFLEQDASKTFKIADMKLCYASTTKMFIFNPVTTSWPFYSIFNGPETLDSVEYIKYEPADQLLNGKEVLKSISDEFYMSERDIQITYLNRFKVRGLSVTGENFVLSCCDNTKRFLVQDVKLCTKKNEYKIEFINTSGIEGYTHYYYEVLSPDRGIRTRTSLAFLYKEFNGQILDCIRLITETIKFIEDEDRPKSSTEIYYDLNGKILQEVDEYKLQTVYNYDPNGLLIKKMIKREGYEEQLVFSVSSDVTSTIEEDYKSKVKSNYDSLFGNVESIEYNGKNEDDGNKLTTFYGYNNFKDNIISVGNNVFGRNYLQYGPGGRLVEASPYPLKAPIMYGYKFKYNQLGDPCKYYLTYKNAGGYGENLQMEKVVDRLNGAITTYQYRKLDKPDLSTVILDKYGKTKTVEEGGKSTTFKRQELKMSDGVNDVEEMYDPYEERKYIYNYDVDSNNIKGYSIKGSDGSNFLTISAEEGNNKILYHDGIMPHNIFHTTETKYDADILMKPRVVETKDNCGFYVEYQYDELGRGCNKKLNNFIEKETEYKYGTLLKKNITTKISLLSKVETCKFNYNTTYDERGNLETNSLMQTCNNISSSDYSRYTYDRANRLKTEYRKRNGNEIEGIISYDYNLDGSINTEKQDSKIKQYFYEKGRLLCILSSPDVIGFSYDNLGNCTSYLENTDGAASLSWERGKLLKEFTRSNLSTKYYYNSKGFRFKKTIGDKTTTYYLDGSKLIAEKLHDGRIINYIYDTEGIIGFNLSNKNDSYYFVKDVMDNVISIVHNYDEVAHYEYDAWGNVTITKDVGEIATLNPIRWKSQYYDSESGLYYIGGRYYSTISKQFISSVSLDIAMANAGTIYGLNLYLLNTSNPVNMIYNGHTIETSIPLTWIPAKLTKWEYFWGVAWPNFWRRPFGKVLAIVLFILAIALTAVISIFVGPGAWAGFLKTLAWGVGFFTTGATIAGFRSMNQGNGFFAGFTDYINDNWSQSLAITSAIYIVALVGSLVRVSSPQCFKAGTKILTATGYKDIEDIEVGDKVWSYDEDTGEKGLKEVVRLLRNSTESWTTTSVLVEGSDEISEITSTPGHKYYLPFNDKNRNPNEILEHVSYNELGINWVSAQNLKKGDKVLLSNGKYGIIIEVETNELDEPETTYNFEVEDFHTYYVGENAVLVHNLNCGEEALKNLKVDEFTIKSKHLNSTGGDWAKFNVGTEIEAKALVKEALLNGEVLKIGNNAGQLGSLGQKSFDAYINAGRIIGTQGQTTIKIVYDQYSTIWTLFPK